MMIRHHHNIGEARYIYLSNNFETQFFFFFNFWNILALMLVVFIYQFNLTQVKPIVVAVEKRQGRKMITLVRNLENFMIDPATFARDAQKKFAASASIHDFPGAGNGKMVIKCVLCILEYVLCNRDRVQTYNPNHICIDTTGSDDSRKRGRVCRPCFAYAFQYSVKTFSAQR